jgi:hypothetical protein
MPDAKYQECVDVEDVQEPQGSKTGDFQRIGVTGELVVWSRSLRSSINNEGGQR